ncbi:MAG: hypothetical protein BGO43_07405 [Gammaproteobacteria bacterium 39-13]|nr:ribosome assembly RNA-binding protein YhbY [Gammaproteobacteria bacterium]OJV91402.1 MAG: hypothetical protein BGO43_07405 [Gammaproteobacteria bacterium 39-13]
MLTRPFLKNLATKAHQLHPIVIVGGKGLTIQVHQEIDAALTAHELLKIRINAETREARQQMIAEIAEHHQATIVQAIGHVLVLYRPKKED